MIRLVLIKLGWEINKRDSQCATAPSHNVQPCKPRLRKLSTFVVRRILFFCLVAIIPPHMIQIMGTLSVLVRRCLPSSKPSDYERTRKTSKKREKEKRHTVADHYTGYWFHLSELFKAVVHPQNSVFSIDYSCLGDFSSIVLFCTCRILKTKKMY